jgi:cell wall-associated NlpC family hydrolase
MRRAPRQTLLFSVILLVWSGFGNEAPAQSRRPRLARAPQLEAPLPVITTRLRDFAALVPPALPQPAPFAFPADTVALLQSAIMHKLGVPYRLYGTDDRGYDCSGLIWRVFQEAGIGFERASARDLWSRFREATPEETRQFGTLVFFNDLKHIGILRDASSFYHASSSQGVILSSLTGYWGERITGFRRIPLPGDLGRIEVDAVEARR